MFTFYLNAIRPPNANPSEKKICVPASSHTTGSNRISQRGVNKYDTPSIAPARENIIIISIALVYTKCISH